MEPPMGRTDCKFQLISDERHARQRTTLQLMDEPMHAYRRV